MQDSLHEGGPTSTRHGGSDGRCRWADPTREPGDALLSELQMQDTAANVSEVCVETTVVVDTLGPARRRTYGLCVTVRCSDRYLCTCRIEKECVKYTSLKKTRCQLAWPHESDSKFVAAGICQRRSGLHSWDLEQQKPRPSRDVNGCVCVCVLRASTCVIACVVFISLTKHTHHSLSSNTSTSFIHPSAMSVTCMGITTPWRVSGLVCVG